MEIKIIMNQEIDVFLSDKKLSEFFESYLVQIRNDEHKLLMKKIIMIATNNHLQNKTLAICRKKDQQKLLEFIIKYVYNLITIYPFETGLNPRYYDSVVDIENQNRYYSSLERIDYDGLNNLLFNSYKKGDRRIGLWALVDRQPDGTLRCAYSNNLIEDNLCQRQVKADEEHLVPQSWHSGSKTHPGQDMHQIFVVTKSSNGSRGNLIYYQPTCSTMVQKEGGSVYAENGKSIGFIPNYNLGAICRATLYTLLTYKDTFHSNYFFRSVDKNTVMSFLIQKAMTEPVTFWEKHRNYELYKLQGNRNPFTDHPEWADKVNYEKAFSD